MSFVIYRKISKYLLSSYQVSGKMLCTDVLQEVDMSQAAVVVKYYSIPVGNNCCLELLTYTLLSSLIRIF